MGDTFSGLEETINDFNEVVDARQIPLTLHRFVRRFGLKTVAYLAIGPLQKYLPTQEPYIAATYSPEWIQRYRALKYLKIDPTIQVGLRRLLPVEWDDLSTDQDGLRTFFGEARDYGLGRRGISFPVHGYRGDSALFSVTADFGEREWKWARQSTFRHLPIAAMHLHEAVMRIGGIFRAISHLSRRELECLRWTSEGKTVWECAMILGVSHHTARCYLESARRKLGASSNTHAVSLALKSGLLHDLL